MPLCHRDHAPESISLQQRSVAKVQLSLLDSLLGEGPWGLGRVRTLSPTSCSGVWEQRSPVATCGGQLVTGTRSSLSFKTTPTSPTTPPGQTSSAFTETLGLLTPPRLAAAAGEVLEFPAQPDSAQSSSTFLPPLGCGLWNPSGRRLGVFPSGPVVSPRTLTPVPNLFLLFTPPRARHALRWSPDACSASRSASRLCAGGGWYGVEVGVLGCFPSIYGRQMESLRHSSIIPPGKGWEHLESSRRALTHPAASLTSYSWLSSPSDKKRAASVGSGRR